MHIQIVKHTCLVGACSKRLYLSVPGMHRMSIARLVGRARWIFGDITSPCSLSNAGIFRLPLLLAHHVKAQSFISNRRPRSQYLPQQSILDLNACGQKGVLDIGFRAFSKCTHQATLGYNQHAIAQGLFLNDVFAQFVKIMATLFSY